MNEAHVDIALFPIPGSVSLPFHTVPLHIFEPRYRKMITDSVKEKRRIGIAHTIREVAPARIPEDASADEALHHNLETYEAHPIFSAGFPRICETLPDGRMIVEIETDSRYQVMEEIQQIPYKIVRCMRYQDTDSNSQSADDLRKQLDSLLLQLRGPGTDLLMKHLRGHAWKSQSSLQYSFAIFSLIQIPPDFLQMALEMKSPEERISFVIELFTRRDGLDH
jgi:Lon protease-like protein